MVLCHFSWRAFLSLNYTFHHPFHMIYVQCHDHIPKFFNPLCTHNPKILFPELVPKLVHQIEHHFIYVIGEEHYSRSVLQRASRQCLSVQVIQIFLPAWCCAPLYKFFFSKLNVFIISPIREMPMRNVLMVDQIIGISLVWSVLKQPDKFC